tara:strand:- start:3062 stop:3265 length:204 start_codon:yes stop_codon:yes gene_type:complete
LYSVKRLERKFEEEIIFQYIIVLKEFEMVLWLKSYFVKLLYILHLKLKIIFLKIKFIFGNKKWNKEA